MVTIFFFFFFYSMFISVEDHTGMSFIYSQEFTTEQAGDTFCTRSYSLINQNMYDFKSKKVMFN